ncbi:MAG: FHA domain-containing protein, partial [Zetaproteobacteria bacterium]
MPRRQRRASEGQRADRTRAALRGVGHNGGGRIAGCATTEAACPGRGGAMPSLRFPATATLLDAKRCPLDKFDALFTKITRERRVRDGYFLHDHPHGAHLLFLVNGSPYTAGRVVGDGCVSLEIHEFFTAYTECPESPLSFFVADKRLLLGLMVLFRHRPALTFDTNRVGMTEILAKLAERNADQILALRSGSDWAIALCARGRPVASFLPWDSGDAAQAPAEQLAAFAGRRADGVAVDAYEETRATPAGDVILVTPETRGRLVEVFLKVAARVKEEEAARTPPEAPPEESLPLEAEVPASLSPIYELPVTDSPAPTAEPDEPLSLQAEPAASPSAIEDSSTAEPLPTPERPIDAVNGFADDVALPQEKPRLVQAPEGPVPEVLLFVGDRPLGAFSLAAGELTIGRTPGNSIMIDNAGVSRRHAVIRVVGDNAILEDLGSANGTFVRGQRVEEYTLRDGDEISIVKHRLVYRVPKEARALPKAEPIADGGQRTMYIDTATIAQAAGSRSGPRPETAATTLRPRLILPDLKKFALED